MTTRTDRRTVTMPELVEALSQPDEVDLSDTLVQLGVHASFSDSDNGYPQQTRVLSAILGRKINQFYVCEALSAVQNISLLEDDGDVTEMYGHPNTQNERDRWLAYEQEMLADAVNKIRGHR